MDLIESSETLLAVVEAARKAGLELIDSAGVKVDNCIRNAIAEAVSALMGWELVSSPITLDIDPITIKLTRNLK